MTVKLHLGCGKRDFGEGWINVDGEDYPHIKFPDVRSIPLPDNHVDVIYTSHTLEYFDREEAPGVLQEWRRLLKPEGQLYISVPDFAKMSQLYWDKRIPLHKFLGPLYGKMGMAGNHIFHKTVYDYASLGELLRFTGFRRIEPWEHGELEQLVGNEFDDHSKAKIDGELISLNLKCQK
jgi:predicted SAM-dependent methyltransferase